MNCYTAMVLHNTMIIALAIVCVYVTGSLWGLLALIFCVQPGDGD